MLTQYEKIIEGYKLWYPSLYSRTVECRPSGKHCILATLNDGSKIEYSDVDDTIRDVTRFYIHETDNMNEESWRKEFGRKLHKAIIDNGINQEMLSDKIGISRQMLSRYVRGNSTPSGYILTKLSEALNCDVRELTRFGYIDED